LEVVENIRRETVSILTPPRGGVRQAGGGRGAGHALQVSILTPPRGGVRLASGQAPQVRPGVSILTPPRGGVRLSAEQAAVAIARIAFQSSLRPEAECDRPRNPSHGHTRTVSILTPPRGGVR